MPAADLLKLNAKVTEYGARLKVTSPKQGGGTETSDGAIIVKGSKLAIQATVQDKPIVMLYDTSTKVAYVLMTVEGQNLAVKSDLGQASSDDPTNTFANLAKLLEKAKATGVDKVDDQDCTVFETTIADAATGKDAPTKVWVGNERGVVYKLEVKKASGTETTEFSGYKFVSPPDNLFVVPDGFKIVEAPAKPAASGDAGKPLAAADLLKLNAQNTQFSVTVKTTKPKQGGGTETTDGNMAGKGQKFRIEMTTQGQQGIILVDLGAKVMHVLTETNGQKVALKIDLSQAAGADAIKEVKSPGDISLLLEKAKPVGVETVDGKVCTVFETTTTDSATKKDAPAKIWVWNERGILIKIETTTAAGVELTEFKDYKFDSVADSLFAIPAGYQEVDMATLLAGAGTPTPAASPKP